MSINIAWIKINPFTFTVGKDSLHIFCAISIRSSEVGINKFPGALISKLTDPKINKHKFIVQNAVNYLVGFDVSVQDR